MKYMLLIYGAEGRLSNDDRNECMAKSRGICEQLATQGKYLAASPLQSVTTAATIRIRDGKTLITDGPFAETTEQLGGYYVLDLTDLDEAIAVATRLPPVAWGTVEIRPMVTLEGLPPDRPLPAGLIDPAGTPYLLLCYHEEQAWRDAGDSALCSARAEATALCRRIAESGQYLSASPLHPSETATSVRVRDGKRIVTDGPFAETREVLGGYYLVLAPSREAALDIAAQTPGVHRGSIEVRPLFDLYAK